MIKHYRIGVLVCVLAAAVWAWAAWAQGHGHAQPAKTADGTENPYLLMFVGEAHSGGHQAAAWAGDPYLLKTDPVSGEALGARPVVIHHEGRELRFASEKNAAAFRKDPKAHLAKVDAELVAQQLPHYPLGTCLVTGEKLEKAVDVIYRNRLVRLCCEGCRDELAANSAALMAKLDAAVIEKQKASYPLTTCVVLGGKLGSMGEPANHVVGNRLLRYCCAGCGGRVQKDPVTYLSKLDEAIKGR